MFNAQSSCKANRVSSESHQACLNGRVAFEVDKVNAMSSLLEHCRAVAELQGEALMFNVVKLPTSLEQRKEILCFLPLKSVVLFEWSEAK